MGVIMENRKLKVANFNISGGFYIGNEDNEYLDREAVDKVLKRYT